MGTIPIVTLSALPGIRRDHNRGCLASPGPLYRALFDSLAPEPSVHVALAGIALPNDASVALHRNFGFTEVGTFREYAIKNGQYISSVWMQRLCHSAPPPRQ
jgi:predicted GNAT superfamily acetyltransferase